MLNYLCLIVKPNSKSLTSSIIDHSKDILASCHDSIIEEKWLEINESYEILLKSNNTNELNILFDHLHYILEFKICRGFRMTMKTIVKFYLYLNSVSRYKHCISLFYCSSLGQQIK